LTTRDLVGKGFSSLSFLHKVLNSFISHAPLFFYLGFPLGIIDLSVFVGPAQGNMLVSFLLFKPLLNAFMLFLLTNFECLHVLFQFHGGSVQNLVQLGLLLFFFNFAGEFTLNFHRSSVTHP